MASEGASVAASSESLATLRELDPYEFEHYVADVWESRGWETEVRQQSGDRGIDVMARKTEPFEQTQVIQAKRYGDDTKVGGPEIQQYASLREQVPDADTVVVVTTGSFTDQAQELAKQLNVKTVNGQQLIQMAPSDADEPDEIEAVAKNADGDGSILWTALGVLMVVSIGLGTLALGHQPRGVEEWLEASFKLVVVGIFGYVIIVEILPRLIELGLL